MTETSDTFVLGAVAYDPKVVTIWEGFKEYFARNDFRFDYVLYSNYERQVEALLADHIHVAWNSPLAWIRAERLGKAAGKPVYSLLMRDTDQDLCSTILTTTTTGVKNLEDLKGKTIGFGAIDSPQATLLPLELLRTSGLEPQRDFSVRLFNLLPGKHGDHIGGEREAVLALVRGEVDAACVLESNCEAFIQEGILAGNTVIRLGKTPRFDHCNFTVSSTAPLELVKIFYTLLSSMSYSNPEVKVLFDLEGLKEWRAPRVNGYTDLNKAVDSCSFYDSRGAITAREYLY